MPHPCFLFSFVIDGSSEFLFISLAGSRGSPAQAALSAACGGIHLAPRTRVTFCTHKKSPKKRRETRTPFFVQSVSIRYDTGQPLKYPFDAGPS